MKTCAMFIVILCILLSLCIVSTNCLGGCKSNNLDVRIKDLDARIEAFKADWESFKNDLQDDHNRFIVRTTCLICGFIFQDKVVESYYPIGRPPIHKVDGKIEPCINIDTKIKCPFCGSLDNREISFPIISKP